jgi:DNA-binding transcriptional ArsR family regulator
LNVSARKVGRRARKDRKRQPVPAMTHALNHWLRVEIISILHEGEFSAGEIADMIGVDVKAVTDHIHDLYESGCIEFAGHKEVDGLMRPVYRAVVPPEVSDEVYRAMSDEDRDDASGAIVQGVLAEAISSCQNGKLIEDETVALIWGAPTLDAQGEHEMNAHLTASYRRAQKIHAKAASRMAKSGEIGVTKVVAFLGFRRGRSGRPEGGYFNSEFQER